MEFNSISAGGANSSARSLCGSQQQQQQQQPHPATVSVIYPETSSLEAGVEWNMLV